MHNDQEIDRSSIIRGAVGTGIATGAIGTEQS
jgi:hypothetical protein